MSGNSQKVFIGVAWPYVNGDIHIGHLAGYLLPADIYARFHRFCGNEVLMVSGSDCHGTPITVEAEKEGVHPRKIVEKYHKKNLELFDDLKLSFDNFTKTTTDNHKKVVQDIFVKGLEKGYIVKGKTKQYYSEEEGRFLPDRYVEGTCPFCGENDVKSDQCDNCGKLITEGTLKNPRSKRGGSEVQLKETEHYFFDWGQLQDFLEEYVENRGENWRKWVRSETKKWLKEGLKPRAITRDIDWGIELPVDRIKDISDDLLLDKMESKSIYVWFEAVIGYLSASIEWTENSSGSDWKDFWYNKDAQHAYFMGKDNLVFHTLFWPGQLHVYDDKLHLPDNPAVNQFLNLENKKFSKSKGITIDSSYIIKEYGLDPVRFYIASIMPEQNDANFSWEDFIDKHNNVLIGTYANFINRTLKMAQDVDIKLDYLNDSVIEKSRSYISNAKKHLRNTEFRSYVKDILDMADFGNKYLSKKEPWKDKDEENKAKTLTNSLFLVLSLQLISSPLLVESVPNLEKMTGVTFSEWSENEIEDIKRKIEDVKITEPEGLFEKIERIKIKEELDKLN